jgi:hypothetical protein
MVVTAGIFLASVLLKEMRYLVYIRYLWYLRVSSFVSNYKCGRKTIFLIQSATSHRMTHPVDWGIASYTKREKMTLDVYIRKNARVVTDLQTSCNEVVVKPMSGCVRTACSQLS